MEKNLCACSESRYLDGHIFLRHSQFVFSSFMPFLESKQRLFNLRQSLKVNSVCVFAVFAADIKTDCVYVQSLIGLSSIGFSCKVRILTWHNDNRARGLSTSKQRLEKKKGQWSAGQLGDNKHRFKWRRVSPRMHCCWEVHTGWLVKDSLGNFKINWP